MKTSLLSLAVVCAGLFSLPTYAEDFRAAINDYLNVKPISHVITGVRNGAPCRVWLLANSVSVADDQYSITFGLDSNSLDTRPNQESNDDIDLTSWGTLKLSKKGEFDGFKVKKVLKISKNDETVTFKSTRLILGEEKSTKCTVKRSDLKE